MAAGVQGTLYLSTKVFKVQQADGTVVGMPMAAVTIPYSFVLMYDPRNDEFTHIAGPENFDFFAQEDYYRIMGMRKEEISFHFDTDVYEQRELKGLIEFLKEPVIVVPRVDGSKPEKEKMRRPFTLLDKVMDDGSAVKASSL